MAGRNQLLRLLTERHRRVPLSMGFEADECLKFKPYGIATMQLLGYRCVVVRDSTAIYETAETLPGMWKTRLAIDSIETRFGYSITSEELLRALRAGYATSDR